MCENSTGIIMYANPRNCTSLYKFFMISILHILDKSTITVKFATAKKCGDWGSAKPIFLISDYRRTHNFTNWLQSAQRRRILFWWTATMCFIFEDLLTVANFFMKGLFACRFISQKQNTSHFMRKFVLCHMRTTKAQISLRIHTVWWAPLCSLPR